MRISVYETFELWTEFYSQNRENNLSYFQTDFTLNCVVVDRKGGIFKPPTYFKPYKIVHIKI